MKHFRLICLFVVMASCSSNAKNNRAEDDMGTDSTTDAATSGDAEFTRDGLASDPDGSAPLPDRCVTDPQVWSPGTPAFRDASMDVGLASLGAAGIRISGVDFDGDGWADLAIRKGGNTPDDFESGERGVWLLRNQGDGTFEDVTQSSGFVASRFQEPHIGRPAEVLAFADIDNDGDLDAFSGFTQDGTIFDGAELMMNAGDGTFAFGPQGFPFAFQREPSSVGGATFTDVDRDGRIDLWLGRGVVDGSVVADKLYVQNADGGFDDRTAAAGAETEPWTLAALNAGRAHSNSWSSAACDLNGDGNPDLLSASYGRAPNKLFLATSPGEYSNESIPSGYAFDQRTDWSDNESARCWCKLHPTDAGCDGVPEPRITCNQDSDAFRWTHGSDREPFRLGGNSGTTVCGDIDNDGDLDLLTSEIVHWDVGSSSDPSELLFNDGAAKFDRPGNSATGLTRPTPQGSWDNGDITGAIFDFDNDMRADVYIGSTDYPGTRGWLFHQKPDGTFESVPFADGIDHTRSHGIAVADFDRDGDLDVVVGHSTFRCSGATDCYDTGSARYFANDIGQASNWLQLSLEGGEGTNRAAIGARVTVTANGVTQTQEVGGGHGHYGIQHDLTLHFGLAEACEAEITVRWPDAELSEQSFTAQAGYRYAVKQGEVPRALTDQ